MSAIVVVGGGAAGTCLVTRICAGAPRLGGVLDLHVVDPYPPGAGRTWRGGAARADSAAGDLTAFPDGAGPSLADWLGREPGHLARRSEVGDYLADAFGRAARGAPPNVRVHAHRARAVGLDESAPAGRQRVRLSDGGTLTADAVVLAHGRPAAPPTDEEAAEAVFAARHGLVHLPGGHAPAGDVPDLELLRAGEPVLVHGSGRAFTDLTALLTTGRGGRFAERGRGETVYLPSGDEPLLHVTSHAGVPHHARPAYGLAPGPPPRCLVPGPPSPESQAKGLAWAYYRELFTRHGARTRTSWPQFEAALAAGEWGGKELRALVTRSVPRFADRLHLDRLRRPLHGMRFGDLAGLQRWMHGYLAADLERRADPAFSADLALIHALVAARAAPAGDPEFDELYDLLAGGPSHARQAELRALARAGVVIFLGAEPRVERDEEAGVWRASGPTVPGSTEARALVDARRAAPDVRRTADPLLAGLFARGECRQAPGGLLDVRLPDRRLVTRRGAVHARRFALGPWTAGGPPGFDGPTGSAPLLDAADALARAVLVQVAGAWLHAAA